MFCLLQQTAAVYLYSFNYLFFVMNMQCAFCGVPTDLWNITKRYVNQKALPRHPAIYLLHFTLADIG